MTDHSIWRWATCDRKTRVFAGVVLACLIVPAAAVYWNIISDFVGAKSNFNDFFGMWSVARIAHIGHAATAYDFGRLTEFRRSLDATFDPSMPYADSPWPYPPYFTLMLWPLGFLSFCVAYGVWVFSTFCLYGLAVSMWVGIKRLPVAAVLLLAPATVYVISFGQNGFLSAALLTAGLRFARPRPVLAGVLLGLMAFKPQLGVLIPIALASARLWRTFAAAGVTVLLLVGASGMLLGWTIWPDWLAAATAFPDDLRLRGQNIYHLMPTTMANLLMLGTAWPVARAVQFVVSAIAAIAIWFTFRNGVNGLSVAALLVGVVLVSPYAYIYDLPMVTIAVLLLIRERDRPGAWFALPEIVILAAALVLPYVMVSQLVPVPISAPVLGALFCVIVLRAAPARVAVLRESALGAIG